MPAELFPKITERGIEDLRKRIGVKITDTLEPWCHEASRDGIRHYAHGIGDDNPLWCDPAYAARTRWGGILAPPSFLFATSRIISGYVGGLPGVHAMWAGAQWDWHLPVRRNDTIATEAWLKDLVEHQTKFAGRSIQQIYHVDFYNQDGALVAAADSWCFRTDRDIAREQGTKYAEVKAKPPRRYSDDELAEHHALYASEDVRGATPRHWADVREGEPLPTMAKGPMTVTGFIAYAQGWGGLYIRANKLAWKQVHRHPGLGIKNRFGIPDCPERVHWEQEFATMVGAPGAYDYGPERCSWLTHHLTNWMGDDGVLRRAHCKIRRHNPEGDLLRIDGTVVRKRVEEGRHLVDIEQEARNQDGELSVIGGGTVELPQLSARTLRGKVAVAGIGETAYYKHGKSPDPEFTLALKAILRACEDAGISPREVDGFASYSNDRNDPSRIAAALGLPELRFSNMQWGGGGGGGAAAVGNAAAAVAAGMADCVVVFRALAQGQFARFGLGAQAPTVSGEQAFTFPYGLMSPGQRYAMKAMRFMHEHGIGRDPLRAIALASYHHAQANPRAVMHGRPLSAEMYDASRWIVEPFRLFDCCLENDGAAALVLVSAERARDLRQRPVYLLGVAQGSEHRNAAPVHNAPLYGTSSFTTVAPHLYEMAGVSASDVDVVQSYENFTGGVLMSLVEHGLFRADEAMDVCTLENLTAPKGRLPLNTSGGNLAECYMHGLELQLEAVRQLRGQSSNQVPDAEVAMVCAGPMVTPVSSLIVGTEATL